MIINQDFEKLMSIGNNPHSFFVNSTGELKQEVDFDELENFSNDICVKWEDYYCDNTTSINFKLTEDMKLKYLTTDGEVRCSDITEFAFGQLCIRLGIPSSYIKKCFENRKMDLAVTNFQAWSLDCDKVLLIRENEGVIRAVLSAEYKSFDSSKVIKTVRRTVDRDKYAVHSVYLSEDRLHLRFVDRKPLNVKNEKSNIFAGFVVSSSDVGRGSLNMKYHLYRQVCNNGMVISENDGTLFKQAHSGSKMTDGKIHLFHTALQGIDKMNEKTEYLISDNQKLRLGEDEFINYMEKVKRELKLSEKANQKMLSLVKNVYDTSKWGVLNSITELAHDFTLDTRIDFETFAGNEFYVK